MSNEPMKPYPVYKDSGVVWIGEIPSHWEPIRLGMLGIFSSSGIDKKSNESEISVRMVNFTDIIRSRKYFNVQDGTKNYMSVTTPHSKLEEHRLRKGDMVFIPSSETKEDLGYSSLIDFDESDIVYSYHIIRYQTRKPMFHYFKKYLVNHHSILNQFSLEAKGTTRQIIGRNVFRNVRVVLPTLSEQTQIVTFLDFKTQKIDELIVKTEQKIELLREKRTAFINHCVTKGLNPNVEMKDSGVEWIGEIPIHWIVSKLKYDTSNPVRYGMNISSDKYVDEGIRFIRITDITDWGELIKDNGKYLIKEDVTDEFLLDRYDILLCRSGHTVGKSYLHLEDEDYTSGGYLVRFNFGDYSKSKFIFYVSKTDFYWYWIQLNTVKSTIENVNGDKYSNMVYPKPPDTEQIQIVEYLDEKTQKIDSTIEKETQRIELLKEYRQSLISEVVTGKIDVRDHNG